MVATNPESDPNELCRLCPKMDPVGIEAKQKFVSARLDQRRPTMEDDMSATLLLVVIAVLGAALIGVIAGILAKVGGRTIPNAILYGGGAFASMLTLTIIVMAFSR